MENTDTDEGVEHAWFVVVNDEDQYSVWADGRPVPDGWRTVGEAGDRAACLAYIEEHWTDMRPKSARGALASGGNHG
ncbi:MbtH family protein [Streptomyces sp. NPDC096310]|uniref:MbtH family protein n=1 Tax=Streptomyces sp. NPDC096310 TaxID=3366082 RepID=UPI0038181A14